MRQFNKVLLAGLSLVGVMAVAQAGLAMDAAVHSDILQNGEIGAAIPAEELGGLTGRQDAPDRLELYNQRLTAYLGGNALSSTATGANALSGDALAQASGIATVIQNSGNQVIIQNSMILNLSVQ